MSPLHRKKKKKQETVHELRFVDFTYRYFIYLGFPVLKEEKEEKKVSIIYDIYRNAGFCFVFFFNEIQVSRGVPVLLSFPFARNFKQHCLSVSSGHVKVWNRSAVFTMLQRASTLPDISCLFLLIKVGSPLQNQDAGATKDRSDQIRSVAQLCPTLCDPMNRSTPDLPVHHQLPEFTQTHVHRVSDAIQPSHPLSSETKTFRKQTFMYTI